MLVAFLDRGIDFAMEDFVCIMFISGPLMADSHQYQVRI